MLTTKKMFPCPVCGVATEVRITKKDKPYVTCYPCGIQLFIRGPAGVSGFNRLVARGEPVIQTLSEMERRYRLTCEECGTQFWAEPQLAKTSIFDGHLQGFRCPKCNEVVSWKTEE
jgi:transcription elongation factor Elf1